MFVYLVANRDKEQAKIAAEQVADILQSKGAVCYIDNAVSGVVPKNCENMLQAQAIVKADCVVTIGGDGTLLHTASELMDYDVPIIGINVGRLGFLTELEQNQLEKLDELINKNYKTTKRKLIKVELENQIFYAINEVVLCSTGAMKTIRYNVKCDGVDINSYRGDGVIVASPTGSTAYSLSAGGPIVDSAIDCMIVTAVCAHSLNTPPIVFSEKRVLEINAAEMGDVDVALVIDGISQATVKDKEKITVTISDKTVKFIRMDKCQQFKAINEKLKRR